MLLSCMTENSETSPAKSFTVDAVSSERSCGTFGTPTLTGNH